MAVNIVVHRQYGAHAMQSCAGYPSYKAGRKHTFMLAPGVSIGAARSKLRTSFLPSRLSSGKASYAAFQACPSLRRAFRCRGTLSRDAVTDGKGGINITRPGSWTRENTNLYNVGEGREADRVLESPLFSAEDNADSPPGALSFDDLAASSNQNGHLSTTNGAHVSTKTSGSQSTFGSNEIESGPLTEMHADSFSTMEAQISERDVLGGDHETFIMEAIGKDSVHFLAPQGKRRHLPLFVFLPGLDGTGLFCKRQLPGLLENYDVRCLVIPTEDTSTYAELAEAAAGLIRHERVARQRLAGDSEWEELSEAEHASGVSTGGLSQHLETTFPNPSLDTFLTSSQTPSSLNPPFPVTVYGESFGTGIALHLASTYPDEVHSLVILNCVTAFRRQPLLQMGSRFMGAVPAGLHDMGSYAMAPLLADWRRMAEDSRFLLVPPLSTRILTPEAVTHRTQMMVEVDPSEVELGRIQASTLLIASAQDRLMPSVEEADWLASRIPNCRVKVLPDSGHVALLEEGICLSTLQQEADALDGHALEDAAVGQTDRGLGGAGLVDGWKTGEALPGEKNTADEWGYGLGGEDKVGSEDGAYVGQLDRRDRRGEEEASGRGQPQASSERRDDLKREADARREADRGDPGDPNRPEDFAEAYNEERGNRKLRDDLGVELKTMTRRLKEGMDDDRPKEGSWDDEDVRRRIADSLRRKGDLSEGLTSRGIETDGRKGEEGLEGRRRQQGRLSDGLDTPRPISDGVEIAPAQDDAVARRLAENRRKFFEGGNPYAAGQTGETRRTSPDPIGYDPTTLPAAPKPQPGPIQRSATVPKRTAPMQRTTPIVEPQRPAVVETPPPPVDRTAFMPSKKKRTVPIEEVNRRRKSRGGDGSLGASKSIMGGDMRWLQGLGGGLFSGFAGFSGSSKGLSGNQTRSFRNDLMVEEEKLDDSAVPQQDESSGRNGVLPRGNGTTSFLDKLSNRKSSSGQAELMSSTAANVEMGPELGADALSRGTVSEVGQGGQNGLQIDASTTGRLGTDKEIGSEVKKNGRREGNVTSNRSMGTQSSIASGGRKLDLPGTWDDVTDASNGGKGDGSRGQEVGRVADNGVGGFGVQKGSTTRGSDENGLKESGNGNGRLQGVVQNKYASEVGGKEKRAKESERVTARKAQLETAGEMAMKAGKAVTVVWQGQGKRGLLAIGSAAAPSTSVEKPSVEDNQSEASTTERTKTRVKDLEGEAERGGLTSGAGAGQPDPPGKKSPDDLKLAGALAGQAFDTMLDDMPQYRLWNWLTRPEYYGMDTIPVDAAPLLFVGNHTLFGIYDMPLMLYELRKRRGVVPRGLAHEWHWKSPLGEIFEKYGAVKATPRNCFNLLKADEPVLLYPGGGREVAKRKGEKYKLLWKDNTDFVRLAMKCRATIVPFATIGVEDAFDILMGPDEIMASFGDLIRPALKATGFTDDVIPSLATGGNLLPRPERLYFHFGEPIYTSQYTRADLKDKEKCARLYKQAKSAVEDGIVLLQEKRTKDPLRELFPRVMMNIMEGWDGS